MAVAKHVIKKYPNRRLYDTRTSTYITLQDVKTQVLANEDFVVIDAKTEEDLTRCTLLQIILEEESCGMPMFSAEMLAQMIRFYGNAMQGLMGSYLEKNVQAFVEIQNSLKNQSSAMYDQPAFANPDIWTKYLDVQAPMLKNMMTNYIEQSQSLLTQMQDQVQDQARTLLTTFPFGAPASPHAKKK